MKIIPVFILTATIGIPSTVAVAVNCSTTFQEAWRARVAALQHFNKAHPEYVQRHHLNRDLSKQTRRSKEWLRKKLEMQCGPAITLDFSSEQPYYPFADLPPQYSHLKSLHEFGGVFEADFNGSSADYEPSTLTQTIPNEDLPDYESFAEGASEILYPSSAGSNGPYFVGGYFPFSGNGNHLPIFGGSSPSAPITPAAVPEPQTLTLTFLGFLGMMKRRRR